MWDDARALNAIAAVLTGLAVVALLTAAVAWLARRPAFAFDEVVLTTPLKRASAPRLEAALRADLAGTFFTMNLERGRAALAGQPWVRQVSLRRQWPHRLEVAVEEHEPLARWNDNALVDTYGEVFEAPYKGDLPRFGGPQGSADEVARRYREWGAALAPLHLEVRELHRSARGGWHLELAGPGGPFGIELGRDDAEAHLARFIAIYPRTVAALERAGTRVEQVDLRYRNGFAARIPGFRERPAKKAA